MFFTTRLAMPTTLPIPITEVTDASLTIRSLSVVAVTGGRPRSHSLRGTPPTFAAVGNDAPVSLGSPPLGGGNNALLQPRQPDPEKTKNRGMIWARCR